MKKYVLGIDLGTTNVKAALYDFAGTEIILKTKKYPLYTDNQGAATQNIHELEQATVAVLSEMTSECRRLNLDISLISFSAAMHSVLLVDAAGEPLFPLLTWGDRRAQKYVNEINPETASALYARTGTPLHPMNPLVKLLWLQSEYPEIMAKTFKVLDVKSYLLQKLFGGDYYIDYSLANATGLFNMHDLAWDEPALALVGITKAQLPNLVPTTFILQELKETVAEELDLALNIPVVIGASDGCLANLGVNAIAPGKLALTIGTSGAIRTVVEQPQTDVRGRTFCYALTENHWVVGGPVNNGGIVLDWARTNLFGGNDSPSYDEMMAAIEGVQAGADDLFFHPYLVGERAPIWNTDVKGSFIGLAIHHKSAHMMRAMLEGVNFNLYHVYQTIADVIDSEVDEILVTGGFTRSESWLRLLADIFGLHLAVSDVKEDGCLGAAILGLYALGEIKTLEEAGRMVSVSKRIEPDRETHEFYQKHFEKYMRLHDTLLSVYKGE